jgi:hypothetical protein
MLMELRLASRTSLLLASALLLLTIPRAQAATGAPLNDSEAGQVLAKALRSLMPAENALLRGVFEVDRPRLDELIVPFVTAVTLTNDGWKTSYAASPPGGDEKLTVLHRENNSALYTYAAPGTDAVTLVGDRATNSFAGTDFILLDLGLEFFHWPKQVLLTREMRKGRGCDVLESRPAHVSIYSRVVSWIDQETSGLLMAEAYDASGKLLKQFEIRQVRKGQVEEMELRNRQSKTSTRLRFLYDRK